MEGNNNTKEEEDSDVAVMWITETYNDKTIPQEGDVVYKYFPFSNPQSGNYRPCVLLKEITQADASYVPCSDHASTGNIDLLKLNDTAEYFENGSLNIRLNNKSKKFERKGFKSSFCEHPHITR